MRKILKDQQVGLDSNFEYRGKNQTRLETFSDAAFALAVTLLVLSSSVPETFLELRNSMRFIIPFAISVVLLTVIWYQHYLFFLKYGLQDRNTVMLNTALIFLILIYVYPLKFLSRFLFELFMAAFSGDASILLSSFGDFSNANIKFLMIIYGIGAALIFFTVALLYRYAYSKRRELGLSEYEIFMTRATLKSNILMGSVPTLSVLLTLINFGHPVVNYYVSGFSYFLYPIVMPVYGRYIRKKRKARFGTE